MCPNTMHLSTDPTPTHVCRRIRDHRRSTSTRLPHRIKSQVDPSPDLWLPAHTCGETCSRELPCGHTCSLLCHPGPCPACPRMVWDRFLASGAPCESLQAPFCWAASCLFDRLQDHLQSPARRASTQPECETTVHVGLFWWSTPCCQARCRCCCCQVCTGACELPLRQGGNAAPVPSVSVLLQQAVRAAPCVRPPA